MKNVTLQFDLIEEVIAMELQILASWINARDLKTALCDLYAKARFDTRAFFDQHDVWQLCTALRDERADVIAPSLKGEDECMLAGYYDAIATTLSSMSNNLSPVHEACRNIDGAWDFTERFTPHFKVLTKKYPGLAHLKPRTDAEIREFSGSHLGSRSIEFPARITPDYAAIENSNHGKGMAYVILGAAYAHFMAISEKLNTLEMVDSLQGFLDVRQPGISFEPIALKPTGSRHLDTLISVCAKPSTEGEFRQAVSDAKEWKMKTPEQQAHTASELQMPSNADLDRIIADSRKSAIKAVRRHFDRPYDHSLELNSMQ